MAKGRQQYFADEVSIQKEAREFAIEEALKEKIDSVEEGAQVNVIETVKVNGDPLIPDAEKAVDVSVPLVEDTLYSVDTEAALSARQGKVLYDYILNLQSRGRYLSNWNCATGLPTTNPYDSPYEYRPGDYYLVSNVSSGTNYRPDGSEYVTGVASTTQETEEVKVSDMYIYDGTSWQLILNTERPIAIDDALSPTSTNPVENRVVTQAIGTKQNIITDLQTIREGAAKGDTAVQPGDSLSTLSGDSDDIAEGSSHLFMTTSERTKLGNQSGVNTGDETQATIMAKLGAASATTNGYLTSTDWNTFNDKQDAISDLQTIRDNATAGKNASDTIATYGDIVTHNVSEFATAAQGAKADTALQSGDNVSELVNDAGYITDAYHDDTKQDVLTAGDNVTIEEVCIDTSDMQGPAPDGFHVPLTTEWQAVYDIWTALGGGSDDGTNFGIALKLPFAGRRSNSSADVYRQGSDGFYWSSSRDSANKAHYLTFISAAINPQNAGYRAYGYSVRCFKNSPVVPTSNWTKLYGTSIEAGGIFWSATDGLISLSSNGITWITIADKNLGAIQVWNSGDTLSEANCGKYYQWGNNYGFPRTGTIANQSTTQVDASNYGPGNYYSSDTFIKYSGRWDTTDNGNLWGGVSQGSTQECALTISATDTTYVAGDFDIKDLADSTGKRAEWDAKQDALDLGANLSWGQDGKLNATDTTYTAGPGISISANNVISNTRTSAEWGNITGTLSDQTDLQSALDEKQNSFNVVDTLPDVSQADTNATYYLSTGDGKYEEWIVVEKEPMTFVADPNDEEDYIPYDVTFSSPKTLTFYNKTGNGRIEFYDPYGNYPHIIYGDAGEVITGGAEGWYYYDENLHNFVYSDASTYTIPVGTYTMISNGSYSTCYDTISFIEGLGPTSKEWVKVGDVTPEWGTITGTLSNQTDLQNALNLKANLTDIPTKVFTIYSTDPASAWQPVMDWLLAGKVPVVKFTDSTYETFDYYYYSTYGGEIWDGTTQHWIDKYYFVVSSVDGNSDYERTFKEVKMDRTLGTVVDVDTPMLTVPSDIETWKNNILFKNNTSAWTPTGNYQPATKKYVDDAVAGITPGQTYTAGNNIDITNNVISAKNVIKTDATNTAGFTIEDSSAGYVSQIMPGGAYMYVNSGNQGADIAIGPGQVMVGSDYSGDDIGAGFISDDIYLFNRTDMTSTSMKMNLLGYRDNLNDIDEQYELSGGGNNQIARLKDVPVVSATQPTGTEGMIWYDTTNDVLKVYNGTAWKEAGTQMKVLSYGHSTWQNFLDAYNENAIVYCRASSNSNPGSGTQGRMAFMAFVTFSGTTPTSVEFQYYRSRSDHNSQANQLDQVFVYTLTSNNGGTWSVVERNTAAKAVAGTGINLTYGSGNMTISNSGVTSFNGDTGAITLTPGTYLSLNNNVIDVDTSLIATKADLANFAGFLVVAQLPTTDIKTNIIYLLGPVGTGADKYEEYIYSNNNWIMIGDTSIDLSPYFHKTNDDSDDIIEGSTNLFLTSAERTILGNTSGTNTGDETKASIQTKLGAASSSNSGYLTSTDYDTIMSSIGGGGDMSYSDFAWQTKTGATVTLDLTSTITPSANFTVTAPSTIKDGQTYILRVYNGATPYTMTLGTGITNPYGTGTTLTASGIDQFVFLAIGGSLELQPEAVGGGSAGAITNDTTGTTTTVSKIWAGTQAEYTNLSSHDADTIYHIY